MSENSVCGMLNGHWVFDDVVAVAKEADDLIIVEGVYHFYKLDPPWRIR